MFAGQIDVVQRVVLDIHEAVDVRDQVRQSIVHAFEVLAGEAAAHISVCTHAKKHGVVFVDEFLERLVITYAGIEHELHAHAFEQFTPLTDDVLLELERRNTKREQAADLRVGIVDHRTYTFACEDISRGEPGRTCADDRHPLAGINNVRHVGTPAELDRLVSDIALDVADAHGADTVVERARALAQPVLRAHATAYFRQ